MRKTEAASGDGRLARLACRLGIIGHWLWPLRLHTVLTLVTMSIGSFSLAATIFLSSGAQKNLWKDLERLMGDRIDVYADRGQDDVIFQKRPIVGFTPLDLERIRNEVPWAKYVAPMFSDRKSIQSRTGSLLLQVDGIDDRLAEEQLYRPLRGSGFSPSATRGWTFECLATESAAEALSLAADGTSFVYVDSFRARVVGITPDPPETSLRFRRRIIIPYFWAHACFGDKESFKTFVFSWVSPDDMERTTDAVTRALDRIRGPGTYFLSSSQFRIQSGRRIVRGFMLFGASQALFLILIASVGIVSVMLSNLLRRGREFAIRVVMGADPKDLSRLMLLESLALALIGAVAGILLALIVTPALARLLSSRIQEAANLRYSFNLPGFFLPLVVCGLSGLLSGWAPAWKAGRLDILTSLRSE